MTSNAAARGPSPEVRAALFHFTVFGSTGVASAYLAIWLADRQISSTEIGIINAAPVLLALLLNQLIGRLADRARDWRDAIIVLAVIAGIASLGFFFAFDFWTLLIVFTLTTLPAGALVPIIDAATLRMTNRRGTDFGHVRVWGTVGYMVVAALTGLAVGWWGAAAFVPLFVALSLLRTAIAFALPNFRAPAVETVARRGTTTLLDLVRQPWFVLPCVSYALLQATHVVLSTMGALVWRLDGIADSWIGPLIAVSGAAEAVVMFFWRRLSAAMSARLMLVIAGLVATFRWAAMAMHPSLEVVFLLQLLHAVTMPFSLFGLMHFIANWAPEEIAAEAQGFSSALIQGATVITLVVFGWLVGIMGGAAWYVAAGMALAAALASWWSMRLMPTHQRIERA